MEPSVLPTILLFTFPDHPVTEYLQSYKRYLLLLLQASSLSEIVIGIESKGSQLKAYLGRR